MYRCLIQSSHFPSQDVDVEKIELFTSQLMAGYEHDEEETEATAEDPVDEVVASSQYGEDSSVPRGWKLRLDGGRGLLSPAGVTFRSRRQAYQVMVREGQTNATIEEMRGCLKHEGWSDNADLPEGWKVKSTNTNTQYMDRGGQIFKSALAAAKFVSEFSSHFSQQDVEKINKLARWKQQAKARSEPEWNSQDVNIPSGWLSRKVGKRKVLKDLKGTVYKSVRAALQETVVKGERERAETLRRCLEREEGWAWLDLPGETGWLYRHQAGYSLHFIAPTGVWSVLCFISLGM